MKNLTKRTGITVALMLIIITSDIASASKPKKDPKAEKILQEYISALGGKKALSKIDNLVSNVNVVFVEPGITLNKGSESGTVRAARSGIAIGSHGSRRLS
jgi:hypothetical protein